MMLLNSEAWQQSLLECIGLLILIGTALRDTNYTNTGANHGVITKNNLKLIQVYIVWLCEQ